MKTRRPGWLAQRLSFETLETSQVTGSSASKHKGLGNPPFPCITFHCILDLQEARRIADGNVSKQSCSSLLFTNPKLLSPGKWYGKSRPFGHCWPKALLPPPRWQEQ